MPRRDGATTCGAIAMGPCQPITVASYDLLIPAEQAALPSEDGLNRRDQCLPLIRGEVKRREVGADNPSVVLTS